MGGPIPEKYYAKNQQNFVNMDSFSKATVSKGSSLQLDYQIKEESYVIRYVLCALCAVIVNNFILCCQE